MNERTLRPANMAAAALAIGGVLIMLVPQHGPSIIRLVVVTIAAAAGLYALAISVPPTWWLSPFDETPDAGTGSEEVDRIRATLSGRRQPLENGPALPPATLRLLLPLVRAALEREGIDSLDSASVESARGLVSAETLAVLKGEPPGGRSRRRTLPPDAGATAEVVHLVLDDVDRLAAGGRATAITQWRVT